MGKVILRTADIKEITSRIKLYLAPIRRRLNTIKQFYKLKQNLHETILLLCCYLDALANSFISKEIKSKENRIIYLLEKFTSFGPKWNQISLPNLYYLIYRAQKNFCVYFNPIRKEEDALKKALDILELRPGAVPFYIREKDEKLLTIMEKLNALGNIKPGQNIGPSIISTAKVRIALGSKLYKEFNSVIEMFRIGSVLWRDFRCKTVHELYLQTTRDEKKIFWIEKAPIFVPIQYQTHPETEFLSLWFPAKFLLITLKECIDNIQKKFAATKLIPADLYFDLFSGTELEKFVYLDYSTIPPEIFGKQKSLRKEKAEGS